MAPDVVGDVRLDWADGVLDASVENDDLAAELGLRTSILLSLFTDRRAQPDDALPAEDGDRRGWWADQFAENEGDLMGSRLWLLDRSADRGEVAARAKLYVTEALQWMLDDKVTEDLGVEVTVTAPAILIAVTVARPQKDPVTFKFQHVWDGEAARTG